MFFVNSRATSFIFMVHLNVKIIKIKRGEEKQEDVSFFNNNNNIG